MTSPRDFRMNKPLTRCARG